MKKLCYGLLLAFSIMFGLSLNDYSDVSALSYQIDTIPFGSLMNKDYYPYGIRSDFYDPFTIQFDITSIGGDLIWRKHPYFYNLGYLASDGKCHFDSRTGNARPGSIVTVNGIGNNFVSAEWKFPYYDNNLFSFTQQDDIFTKCNIVGPISQDIVGLPPYIFGNPNYDSFKPYRYNYSGLYVHSSGEVNGFHLNNRLDLGELFGCDSSHLEYCKMVGYSGFDPLSSLVNTNINEDTPYGNLPSIVKTLRLPFGVFTNLSDVSTNSSIVLSGRLTFDSKDPFNDNFELSPDFRITSRYTLPSINLDGLVDGSSSYTSSCTYNLVDWREIDSNYAPFDLNFTCPITLSHYSDELFIGFTVNFEGGWTYPATSIVLYDFQAVTNGDTTPSGLLFSNYKVDGNESYSSPGSFGSDFDYPADNGWLTSLVKLFDFSTLNPFAPLFNLFSDNASCASIPIIAGMLNSDEATYCPWFSSDTRNILTPVLGLAGAMLVFGFFIRWLGSSSGNFFEDSKSEEVSNQGGRWGHFKKGAK